MSHFMELILQLERVGNRMYDRKCLHMSVYIHTSTHHTVRPNSPQQSNMQSKSESESLPAKHTILP